MSVGTQKSGLFKAVERQSTSVGTVVSMDIRTWRNVEGVTGIREKGILFLIRHQVRRLLFVLIVTGYSYFCKNTL